MAVTKANSMDFYQRGLRSGFGVIDARQFYAKDADMSADLEQLVFTPWTVNGAQVSGYAITRIDLGEERRYGYRRVLQHEFWIFDPAKGPVNLAQRYPGGYQLKDGRGNAVSLQDAFRMLDEFAAAASYCPHVFMAEEFVEIRNYLNGRMGLPPVTRKDYESYLEHMKTQLESGNFVFVGKITKASDLPVAYDSMAGMEEYEQMAKNYRSGR